MGSMSVSSCRCCMFVSCVLLPSPSRPPGETFVDLLVLLVDVQSTRFFSMSDDRFSMSF